MKLACLRKIGRVERMCCKRCKLRLANTELITFFFKERKEEEEIYKKNVIKRRRI